MKEDLKDVVKVNLTPDLLADVLFWSFYYSQGSRALQNELLHFVRLKNPQWQRQARKLDMKPAYDKITAFLANSETHKTVRNTANIRAEARMALQSLTDGHEFPQRELTINKIISQMLERDLRFLEKDERGGGKRSKVEGPFGRYESHLIRYVILKEHAPGPPIFSDMFEEIRAYLKDILLSRSNIRMVEKLIALHNKTHPQQQVAIPTSLRHLYSKRKGIQTLVQKMPLYKPKTRIDFGRNISILLRLWLK